MTSVVRQRDGDYVRALFFDTCAILKYFLPEKGSDVVRWLLNSETKFLYSLWCTSSLRVKQEFFNVIDRKCLYGQIEQYRANQIKTTATDLFVYSIHLRGNNPPNLPGQDITTDELINRHKLTVGKDDWDMEHIETIVNHLRFLVDTSKVQVVTADQRFEKILHLEGYAIINPENTTIEFLKEEWT